MDILLKNNIDTLFIKNKSKISLTELILKILDYIKNQNILKKMPPKKINIKVEYEYKNNKAEIKMAKICTIDITKSFLNKNIINISIETDYITPNKIDNLTLNKIESNIEYIIININLKNKIFNLELEGLNYVKDSDKEKQIKYIEYLKKEIEKILSFKFTNNICNICWQEYPCKDLLKNIISKNSIHNIKCNTFISNIHIYGNKINSISYANWTEIDGLMDASKYYTLFIKGDNL